jgi:alpha-glucuronidase
MDWRNLKNDRARSSYDNFHALDGQFEDNVVIQIKNGPIDFQVREPVSPIFGGLAKTNILLEVQVTQEYFGQARHTVFLVPQWKEALDFDLCANGPGTRVKDLAAGKTFDRPAGGFVAVICVGLDDQRSLKSPAAPGALSSTNWLGNHLSQANLYGFGRLAWNPNLTSEQIIDEWTRQTLGSDPELLKTVTEIQLSSWRTYENYTGPLGLQTLTDIVGDHYGPGSPMTSCRHPRSTARHRSRASFAPWRCDRATRSGSSAHPTAAKRPQSTMWRSNQHENKP